ncbi:MAG: U32 family peptidase [Chromatiaceae bacterium]|jgi:collagenase-like PrtC family protease|nr:U32 family peptidase [Chromatiaceae bacterium]
MTNRTPRLALGPVPYYWSRQDLRDFYTRAAGWPVDILYLGETVCSKRRSYATGDWLKTAETLQAAGKEVVLSTLALIEAESEVKTLRRLCGNGRFRVEANDLGAVRLLMDAGVPFVTGPTLNIYNPRTLGLLARHGLRRWVLPVELSRDTLADMQTARPDGVETEVFAYGRLPLALSARCFTARSRNLPKDDCRYCCLDYPDGRLVSTQEDAPFVVLNGIQTLSAATGNLLPHLEELRALEVDVLRISPQSQQTERVLDAFASCLAGAQNSRAASDSLAKLAPQGFADGYWRGVEGMAKLDSPYPANREIA